MVLFMGADPHPGDGLRFHAALCSGPPRERSNDSGLPQTVEIKRGVGAVHKRRSIWSEDNPDGRRRCLNYEELLKRDKLSLDLFWIRNKSLADTDSLPAPAVLAVEIADDLEAGLAQFTKIAARLAQSR